MRAAIGTVGRWGGFARGPPGHAEGDERALVGRAGKRGVLKHRQAAVQAPQRPATHRHHSSLVKGSRCPQSRRLALMLNHLQCAGRSCGGPVDNHRIRANRRCQGRTLQRCSCEHRRGVTLPEAGAASPRSRASAPRSAARAGSAEARSMPRGQRGDRGQHRMLAQRCLDRLAAAGRLPRVGRRCACARRGCWSR